MQQLFGLGSSNKPSSHTLPHLRYQYKMNEPFVGGEQMAVQDSHEQARYKIKAIHGLNPGPAKDDKQDWQESLQTKFKDQ
jgi:hypothetical protein